MCCPVRVISRLLLHNIMYDFQCNLADAAPLLWSCCRATIHKPQRLNLKSPSGNVNRVNLPAQTIHMHNIFSGAVPPCQKAGSGLQFELGAFPHEVVMCLCRFSVGADWWLPENGWIDRYSFSNSAVRLKHDAVCTLQTLSSIFHCIHHPAHAHSSSYLYYLLKLNPIP